MWQMRTIRFGRYIGDELREKVTGNFKPYFLELKELKEAYKMRVEGLRMPCKGKKKGKGKKGK